MQCKRLLIGVLVMMFGLCVNAPTPVRAGGASVTALPNPIIFVTQVPIVNDISSITSVFGNHQTPTALCGRGGDLYIQYTDGTLKNLTAAAGYGNAGLQGANGIAVREPSMYWDGTKALFSMVVGAPASQNDPTQFYWQIYEITNLAQNQTPVITQVPNQPSNYNNTNPIYGTNGRIIFSSDRPFNNASHLYPQLDEYRTELANTGLYSLDPATGSVLLLDHAPSGDFRPLVDSYDRVIFSRWDHMQRDHQADVDSLTANTYGSFNYSDESAGAAVQQGDRTEYFPEPQAMRTDILPGLNVNGFEFNRFIPWQINEDGTEGETMNHVGRHDLNGGIGKSFTNDPNLLNFVPSPTRTNKNSINNMIQVAESPVTPGKYYGIDCVENGTHGAGQLITLAGAPSLDAQDMFVKYITDRSTAFYLPEGGSANATYTGHYRNPLPLSDGTLLCVHTTENRVDVNSGTYTNPISRYAFRIKSLKFRAIVNGDSTLTYDLPVTSGVVKTVSYWSDSGLVNFSGTMWELDPVEVKSRTMPSLRVGHIGSPELQVMSEEGVDTTVFRNYLKQHNLAVLVSRNITNRNTDDRQQPFYLKVHNSATQSPNPTGKVYDAAHLQIFEAEYIRGYGLVNGNMTPKPGRRILPEMLNDTSVHNPPDPGGPAGSVQIGTDGSLAAFIPAHRATAWQLVDSVGTAIVRERFWVTFQPGEVRTCASCHGSNGEASVPKQIIPQNKPEAFRTLLQYWKASILQAPAAVTLSLPADGSTNQPYLLTASWGTSALATTYRFQLAADSLFTTILVNDSTLTGVSRQISSLAASTTYYWRVSANNSAGTSGWSTVWRFITAPIGTNQYAVLSSWNLISLPHVVSNPSKTAIYPTAISNAFAYQGSYLQKDTLSAGTGYWLKFGSSQTVTINGSDFTLDTINVSTGWNMIGALTNALAVGAINQVPASIVQSNYFGYNGAYSVTDSLYPSKGYWVKTNQSGQLILSGSTNIPKQAGRQFSLREMNRLTIQDANGRTQDLYFGSVNADEASRYELPPVPPEGSFDARFGTNRMLESIERERIIPVLLSSAVYPVTIKWDIKSDTKRAQLRIDEREIILQGQNSTRVTSSSSAIALNIPGSSALPEAYALEQNYPNPFNPTTTIRYSIPMSGVVILKVYDMLGREVAELTNENKQAGRYEVSFDASKLSSGIYMYTIHAGSFVQSRKLLLLK